MGVVSFLCWVWGGGAAPPAPATLSPPPPLRLPPAPLRPAPVPAFRHDLCAYADSPGTPKRVTFTLPTQLYAWLEAMAVLHNYGSVHKSIRDLLAWACTGRDDDMDWLFATPHEIPACLDLHVECGSEPSSIAKHACARRSRNDPVTLDARLSDSLHHWILHSVHHYRLRGPSDVLDAVCRCAIQLRAADDIFESDESGHDLPATTAELYHDLGIIRCSR